MRNDVQRECYQVLDYSQGYPQITKVKVSEPFHLEIKHLSEVKN